MSGYINAQNSWSVLKHIGLYDLVHNEARAFNRIVNTNMKSNNCYGLRFVIIIVH